MENKMPIVLAAVIGIHLTSPLFGDARMQVRNGRPVVDNVYVNGHGPYRFLVDTGTNVNLIHIAIARKIGMNMTFQVNLESAAGKVSMQGSDGNDVLFDSVDALGKRFLFSGLEVLHDSLPDVQGVLGEWFLSQFDYTLDLRGKRLEFGKRDQSGTRTPFKMINARPTISTSLGTLALDSGANRLVLFRVHPDSAFGSTGVLQTFAGSQKTGLVASKRLIIEGRTTWSGDAVAMASRTEPGVDGLIPLSLFKTIYICNSERYVVFE